MIYREKLTYCKDCGAELRFVRTAYDHWMPCDAMTGEPHFHVNIFQKKWLQEESSSQRAESRG